MVKIITRVSCLPRLFREYDLLARPGAPALFEIELDAVAPRR